MIPYPNISPTLIAIGPLQVRWYGLMYILGFVAGYLILKKRNDECKLGLDSTFLMDFAFYLFVGVLVGGRVGYILFYNPLHFASNPLEIFALWHGGMSFHGGLIGTIVAGYVFCYQKGIHFYTLADTVIPAVPVGLALGRLGNFINGELWGRPTDVAWAMRFPSDPLGLARHPSQLYEFTMEGLLLFAILWILRKFDPPQGVLFWTFMMFYGLFRAIGEQFREPDAHLGFLLEKIVPQAILLPNITAGVLLSLPMFIGGAVMVAVCWRKGRRPLPLRQEPAVLGA